MRSAVSEVAAILGGVLCLAAGLAAQPGPQFERSERSWSQQWSGEAPSASRVELRSIGRVVLRGTGDDRIRYKLTTRGRASRGEEWVPVVFRESGIVSERRSEDTAVLRLREPVCGDCRVEFLLEVALPRETREVDIVTRRGGIDVRRVAGSVSARAVGGSIVIDEIGGTVAASTAGGSIRLGTIDGPVSCETAGGSIEVVRSASAILRTSVGGIRAVRVSGDLDAETGAGSIEVGRVEGALRAKTGGGSIRVAEAANGTRAEAAAGDIWIEKAFGSLELTSGGGDIVAALEGGRGLRDSVLQTSVGSIVVSLPESLALTLDASIRLARGLQGIVSDFPSIQVRRSERQFGPVSEEAAGAINGGGSVMRIRNGVGRIEIRRR